MCGIAGILGKINDKNIASLNAMSKAMTHRGPDGGGTWFSTPDLSGNGCLIAHRRLSVLDLSQIADQPMIDPDTKNALVFNGEIYNFLEIRKQLELGGEKFKSSGDTEVLLRFISRFGSDAVSQLRGMYSFALWNTENRTLFVARDPLGIKPFYYVSNQDQNGDWTFIFASEVRALLASGLISEAELDPTAIESIVWNGFVTGPNTIVKQCKSLLPGESAILKNGERNIKKQFYWDASKKANQELISISDFKEELFRSVQIHLHSDVPVGVFLSSGIDSSALANIAQKVSTNPVHTFTLTFNEQNYNEGVISSKIAQAIGTIHHEIPLTEAQFISELPKAIESLDQPSFDGINCYFLSAAIRKAGIIVALSGTGGDELFGGYTTFRDLPKMSILLSVLEHLPKSSYTLLTEILRKAFHPSILGALLPKRLSKLPLMLESGSNLVRLYQIAYALFLPDFQKQLLASNDFSAGTKFGLSEEFWKFLSKDTKGHSVLSEISTLEQRIFLGERLLKDADSTSMASSLELRVPLVDSVLFEKANRLSESDRYLPIRTKKILRNIGLEGLDPALFNRPKQGFVLPFDSWIQKDLGKVMDETLTNTELISSIGLNPITVLSLWKSFQRKESGIYWSRIWAIFCLLKWCQRYELRFRY